MAHELLVFLTWKTFASARSIDGEIAGRLGEALHRLAAVEQASILELAVLPSHVHAVVEVSALSSLPRLVQRLKGASARFANRDRWSSRGRILRWDPGYDARTVAPLALPQLRRYFDGQADHHRMPLLHRWSSERAQAA